MDRRVNDRLASVDIGQVLKRLGIEAKKRSKEWYSKCPWHDDASPSFHVRDEPGGARHGYWKCFPCNKGGGILDLIEQYLKLEDWRAASTWLFGADGGAFVPDPIEEAPIVRVEVSKPRLSFQLPPGACFDPIEKWPTPPARYWLGRGLEAAQANRWGIGYALSSRLSGRLIIPYRDAKGRPMSYTARDFTGAAERRYLEPEPRERARLSAMFGEQYWPRPEDRKYLPLFVVEGAINGLALEAERPGIFFAATAGSSMRPLYAAKMAGWGLVVTLTDPDAAGDLLAEEIQISLARETEVRRLRLEAPGVEKADLAKLRKMRPGLVASTLREFLGED